MYNPELLYVTANLEETRLSGVAPRETPVELHLDAFSRTVSRPRCVDRQIDWHAMIRPNATKRRLRRVLSRARAGADCDQGERPLLTGLSVQAVSSHGVAVRGWAEQAAREMAEITAYNRAKE